MFTLSKNYRSHQGILSLASLIMGMIWKGFPETVDKLEPEIGNLNGPKPILFLECDSEILRTSNVGLVNLSDRTADFGAEQVILVRDEAMKARLQGEIGDIALILTILDSKGMEFDDVILWDFFASTSDPSGVRSLIALTTDERSAFDGRRHSGMCSELKNLYVAITRARIQFFFIESSEKAMVSIVDLLTSSPSGSLVDVTRQHEVGFPEKLKMLRPGTSVDPIRYSLRGEEFMQRGNYEGAIWCFHRAKDHRREVIAQGKHFEAKGRQCQTQNDIQGFTQNLEAAIELFLPTGKISDAAKNLEKLTRFRDAAELWLKHDEFVESAPLFAKAGFYVQASQCYERVGNHGGAATILREGEHYDEMVCYLCNNRQHIPYESFQSFNLLCKMLLKRNKLSCDHRKYAIAILGSLAEQEKCFFEYGMDDELAALYASQMRHKDLFHLLSKNGKLEEALSLAITKNLLQSTAGGLEPDVLSLFDYVWAGHLSKDPQKYSTKPLRLPSGFLTPSVMLEAEQWKASNPIYSLKGSIARLHVAGTESTAPKTILCLRKILGVTAITNASTLDDLPFEMMQEAVKFAKDLTLGKSSDTSKTAFLLAGLWKPTNSNENLIVLPWSPFREALTDVGSIDPTRLVTQKVLDHLVSAILAFDTKARDLWKEKWPTHCFRFVTLGFCSRKQECHQVHQLISANDCSRKLDDLLQINSVICDLATLHYRRCMNERFGGSYLGIKRYWLERLLRELIYLSSAEQDSSAILEAQTKLFRDKRFIAVASLLEDLLYFRLGKEWSKRSIFTSLLEQMQLTKALGSNVQTRLFRAVSHRLLNGKRPFMQRQLGQLNALREKLGLWDAASIQYNLKLFLRNLDNVEVSALSTLHSLTAVFEYLATYLILKTCATGCVIPNSWIDLHVASINKAINSAEPLQLDDKHRYQDCLIHLAMSFCHTLNRLNKAELPKDFLLCSGDTHKSLLLRQRNAELIAIVIANLAAISHEPPTGFNELWARAKEVFEYGFIKAFHLKSRTPVELTQKLAPSFAKYNGKDALVVVIKDRKKGAAFSNLEQHHSVRTVSFDELCPSATTSRAADSSINQSSEASIDDAHEQYNIAEIDGIIKIQRLWRSCFVKIKNRRSYVSVPVCRATTLFFNLGAQIPSAVISGDQKAMKKLLLSHGVALSLRLDTAKGLLVDLKKDAMTCIENVELSQDVDKAVDDMICQNNGVEVLLQKAEGKMENECLVEMVKLGVLHVLENTLKAAEDLVVEAEQGMSETRKILDTNQK